MSSPCESSGLLSSLTGTAARRHCLVFFLSVDWTTLMHQRDSLDQILVFDQTMTGKRAPREIIHSEREARRAKRNRGARENGRPRTSETEPDQGYSCKAVPITRLPAAMVCGVASRYIYWWSGSFIRAGRQRCMRLLSGLLSGTVTFLFLHPSSCGNVFCPVRPFLLRWQHLVPNSSVVFAERPLSVGQSSYSSTPCTGCRRRPRRRGARRQ